MGASAEIGDPVSQPIFSPEGEVINVKGSDVQVFDYGSLLDWDAPIDVKEITPSLNNSNASGLRDR